ncbi:MAG: UDP-N-acetylmuramate--L-alanine ligase [Rickettsiaceae bacterium]
MILLENKKNKGTLDTIHFIGIGGMGMSGIAEVMYNLGYKVQGSDLSQNNNTNRLQEMGIQVFVGHNAVNITNVSYVVVSSAINNDNPEIIEAKVKKIPVIKRAEMLAELMRLKCSIAVSGSHGKTTTTSLIACIFESAGLTPTVINGGIINQRVTNAYVGEGDYLIAEADESDATFIKIPSTIAVITNIDPEHMDFYKDFPSLVNAFKSFITNLPFYGFAVLCVDHPVVRDISRQIMERRIITYGIESDDANVRAYNIKSDISSSTFDIEINLPNLEGTTIIEKISIPTPGKHNVLNSLAAIAIGLELDFGIKAIKNGFKYFEGVKRRFTKVCEYNGAEIIDDYAHHPVEIKAILATARSIADKRNNKVIAIFQPHRYSRVKDLFHDFIKCFSDSDKLYMLDIYGAGEAPIDGVSAPILIEEIKKLGLKAEFLESHEDISDIIMSNANKGDLIVMMGAGSISSWAYQLPNKFVNIV